MGDHLNQGADPVGAPTSETSETARAVLERAREEATRILEEAEVAARRRAQEAELLIAKARRVLIAAEQKAAVIVATARDEAGRMQAPAVVDLEIGRVVAPGANRLAKGSAASRLDHMLASAINHAVTDAFPATESA